jgi:hypothetical protein
METLLFILRDTNLDDLAYPMRYVSRLNRDNVRKHPRQSWMPSDKNITPHS